MTKREQLIIVTIMGACLLALVVITHYAPQIDSWGMR